MIKNDSPASFFNLISYFPVDAAVLKNGLDRCRTIKILGFQINIFFDTEIFARQAQKEGRHYGRAQKPAIKGNLFSFLD